MTELTGRQRAIVALKHVVTDLELLYDGDWMPAEKDSSIIASLDNAIEALEYLEKEELNEKD
jgi:hypothetical protein